ncbi:hypothetical protein SDC9_207808 [bioreactor metagenome]|uniref:Uncharacterized protein n=1 Tax=bioreactor metagenome TaxID=1076179 RepID=A0A645J8R9_9ZZZZ
MDDDVLQTHLVDRRHLQMPVRSRYDPVATPRGQHWLAGLQLDDTLPVRSIRGSELIPGAIVEDRAVLVDLDKRRPAMLECRTQHGGQMRAIRIDAARHERRLRPQRQTDRVDRGVQRPGGARLGDLADLAGR